MKKKILFSVLAILLIAVLIVGSLAWFFMNENTYVDFGPDIMCEAGESLEISEDGLTWSGIIKKQGFSSETIDITGDGVNFFKPTGINEGAQPEGFATASPVNEDGGEYIEMDLTFRSTTEMSVYLNGDSTVSPVSTDGSKNIFGNFSRDYIAGATRVAFIHKGEVKMIWAPNPQYQLTKGEGGYAFNENGVAEETYYYTVKNGDDYVHTPFSADDFANNKFVCGSTGANTVTEGTSARLFTLSPQNGDFAKETITVRIWFEGTDREANEALAGGKVAVKLKFTGIDKVENTDGQNAVNAIAYNGEEFTGLREGMSYSFDGKTWSKYVVAESINTEGQSTAYFRYDENDRQFRTSVKKVSIS